ncbi:hypothetical protein [Nocardia sp. XZ_19_231]|nr:hypothetical protein [Nocardia sp. XZ_19_231]
MCTARVADTRLGGTVMLAVAVVATAGGDIDTWLRDNAITR